ncbi:unnamed protein product, partial [Didymodactylos carnosus]
DNHFYDDQSNLYDEYDDDLVGDRDNDIANEVQTADEEHEDINQEMIKGQQNIDNNEPIVEYRSSQICLGIRKIPSSIPTTIKKFEDFNTMNEFDISGEQPLTTTETDIGTTIETPLPKKRTLAINRNLSNNIATGLGKMDVFGFNE